MTEQDVKNILEWLEERSLILPGLNRDKIVAELVKAGILKEVTE